MKAAKIEIILIALKTFQIGCRSRFILVFIITSLYYLVFLLTLFTTGDNVCGFSSFSNYAFLRFKKIGLPIIYLILGNPAISIYWRSVALRPTVTCGLPLSGKCIIEFSG
jgi:hypothetical protein